MLDLVLLPKSQFGSDGIESTMLIALCFTSASNPV